MDWHEPIESRQEVLNGKPCLRGTRLSVEYLVGLLGQGWPIEDVLDSYPGLVREDLLACLKYAAESVANEQLFPVEGYSGARIEPPRPPSTPGSRRASMR